MTSTYQQPFQSRAACLEVVARVEAALKIKYQQGCDEHADELLATARRIAELHGFLQDEVMS